MVILLFYTAIFSGSLSCYNLCRLAISPDNLGWKLSQKVSDPICSSKQCQLSYLSKIFQSGLVNLQGQRLRELFRQPTPSPNSPHVETVSLSIQSEPLWFQNMSLAPCHPTMHQSPSSYGEVGKNYLILANVPIGSRKAADQSPLQKSPLFQAQLPQHLFNRQVPLLHWWLSTELTPLSMPFTSQRIEDWTQSSRCISTSSKSKSIILSPTPVAVFPFVQPLCCQGSLLSLPSVCCSSVSPGSFHKELLYSYSVYPHSVLQWVISPYLLQDFEFVFSDFKMHLLDNPYISEYPPLPSNILIALCNWLPSLDLINVHTLISPRSLKKTLNSAGSIQTLAVPCL